MLFHCLVLMFPHLELKLLSHPLSIAPLYRGVTAAAFQPVTVKTLPLLVTTTLEVPQLVTAESDAFWSAAVAPKFLRGFLQPLKLLLAPQHPKLLYCVQHPSRCSPELHCMFQWPPQWVQMAAMPLSRAPRACSVSSSPQSYSKAAINTGVFSFDLKEL